MNLTGEYDVVAEVSVSAINRIVAALHENEDPRYPVMPHSMRMAIDDTPRGPSDPVPEPERTGIQAIVEIQVSAPTLSLPQGIIVVGGITWAGGPLARIGPGRWDPWEPSDISIRTGIRAWVQGSPEPSLPEFVHGDLVISANVVRSTFELPEFEQVMFRGFGSALPWGDTFVGLDRSSVAVSFEPAPGTTVSAEERGRIEQLVRNAMRSDLDPVTFKVTMPEDIRAWDYRFLPGNASVMLMLVLGQQTPSSGAAQGVSGGLISPGSDFAIAVGRDYLLGLLQARVFQGLPESFSDSELGVSATVRPDWAGATFDLEPGRIVATVHGSGHISWWGVDDDFTFDIRVFLGLQVVGGSLQPVAAGDPEVDFHDIAVGEGYVEDKARSAVKEERDKALVERAAEFREALKVQSRLEDILKGFHPTPAGVTVGGVEIRPEGVVVRGNIGLAPSRPVVVRQQQGGGMINARESWIPGGTIDRFVWSRSELVVSPGIAFSGPALTGSRVEEHRFVTEDVGLPIHDVWGPLRCLDVQGRRLTPAGSMAPISGHSCGFFIPLPVWPLVEWPVKGGRQRPVLPIRGVLPNGSLGVVGHYNPWASGRAPSEASSLLVHFAAQGWEETAKVLKEGLGRAREDTAVVVVVLLPEGRLSEAQAGLETGAAVTVGEDPDGHWAEGFGVSAPATVLVDRTGKVAWKEEGELTASKLGMALDRYAEPGGRVSLQPVRLGVAAGDRVPEFPFQMVGGAEVSLRRLRGRRVVLAFWASWSEPSVEQLRELKAASESSPGPLVLAVGDGASDREAAEMARSEAWPFPVIPDPNREISRRFGVGCWPTTLWIGPNLTVDAVDFGLTAVGGRRPDGKPVGKPTAE